MDILPGIYVYTNGIPANCHGCRYRVHRMVKDVPSYQFKVLVEALDGPDRGLWFTCTPDNFRRRYRKLEEPPSPEKVVGAITQGSGV